MECPNCNKDWPYLSEQQIAVEIKGRCMACEINHNFEGSTIWSFDDWENIRNVAMLRKGMHIATNFNQYLVSAGG